MATVTTEHDLEPGWSNRRAVRRDPPATAPATETPVVVEQTADAPDPPPAAAPPAGGKATATKGPTRPPTKRR